MRFKCYHLNALTVLNYFVIFILMHFQKSFASYFDYFNHQTIIFESFADEWMDKQLQMFLSSLFVITLQELLFTLSIKTHYVFNADSGGIKWCLIAFLLFLPLLAIDLFLFLFNSRFGNARIENVNSLRKRFTTSFFHWIHVSVLRAHLNLVFVLLLHFFPREFTVAARV